MEPDGNRRRVKLLCLCIAFLLLGLSLFVLDPFSLRREEPPPAPVETAKTGEEGTGKILVYVVGAVKNPGVYEIPEGSHFYDAVRAAGDVLPYADMNAVNMAEPVTESMKIYIPLDPYQKDPGARGLVNINTAGQKELETLPGVGKVTAEKIITYREEHGQFNRLEDLKHVPSISDGKYKKLADKITL
ncbi:ComEA family DNA-binding protein [uncultured Dialister sp.]|jgi:competence protein ComEA|uniref:ComEA family DNA-binding protein n=1 Tax=uncultured Dialister sp. TaxID=278064 RepID=UPI0025E8BE5F|nr:ComEA family DNA-binding protein [uncultured Dialister sp.]